MSSAKVKGALKPELYAAVASNWVVTPRYNLLLGRQNILMR